MQHRLVRGTRRVVAAGSVIVVSLGGLAGCAVDRAASNPTSSSPLGAAGTTVRVLQLNLCDSGRAGCYSGGRAVGVAASLVHHDRPTMVSLNEVCRDDVEALKQAMSTTFPAAAVTSAFTAARDRATREPVRCQSGQQYGDAVLAAVRSRPPASRTYSGVYPVQDPGDTEERVWVCIDLPSRFRACTTHTASTSTTVALDQCRYLLNAAVPRMNRHDGGDPVILGADLNLEARGSPNPGSCLPSGYQRADDDALQDVVVSPGIGVHSRTTIDMQGATDHPGLLVQVTLPRS